MGLWDKIKNFFGRKDKVKALPEAQSNKDNKKISIRRANGDYITITPRCDRVGNQLFKTVLNHDTGTIQYIPEFVVDDKSLASAKSIHGSTVTNICMDIDPKLLKDETYNYYIADVLLAPERMAEIIDDNMHYAGGLNIGESGQILGYHCEQGIIQGLKASAIENSQRYTKEQQKRMANQPNIKTDINTDHAQILTPEMYDEFYGNR